MRRTGANDRQRESGMSGMSKIAVLGCGVMGARFAKRLANAGFDVSAWNRSPEKAEALARYGVKPLSTAAEACAGRDVVISMMTDGPANDAVLFAAGAAKAMNTGAVIISMGTISVHEAVEQAERARSLGLDYVDAPVSGGETGATEGTLTIMAGGDASTLERLAPILDVLGTVTRMGPVGSGTLAKLASQNIVAVTLCAVSEALVFAERGGADPVAVRKALLGGFARSAILRQHGERMIRADWKPGGVAVNQVKDQKALLRVAKENGLDLRFAELALEAFRDLCDHGDGDLDHSAVYREIQRRCGLPPK